MGLLAVSAAAHIFIFVALGFAPSPTEALLNRNLEFEVVETQEIEPEEEEPEPEKEAEKEEQAAPKPAKRVQPKSVEPPAQEPPEPETTPPPSAEKAPIDFPGLTLTSADGVGSWSTAVGTGKSFKGPVVAPRKKSNTAAVGSGNGTGTGTGSGKLSRVVKKDLSRPPVPPTNMDKTLVRNYPLLAKKQGIEGTAVMRARITTSGEIAMVTLIRETFNGFGQACEKTIKSGRWRPKLDKRGRPIAADITYTCRFEVGY